MDEYLFIRDPTPPAHARNRHWLMQVAADVSRLIPTRRVGADSRPLLRRYERRILHRPGSESVMNPGQLTPHRACAIRCISGGVPPVLLVRQKDGPSIYLLLVSADGKPVNKQVLDMVAEPLEITGEVERQGEVLILRADPVTYREL